MKKPGLKAKLLRVKNEVKCSSDYQKPHLCISQNNIAQDLFLFLTSVYMFKSIYSHSLLGDPDPYQILSY